MAEVEQEPKCRRCGDAHEIFACPHVKAIEFGPNGFCFDSPGGMFVHRIEFLTPADCVARRVDAAGESGPDYPRKGPPR